MDQTQLKLWVVNKDIIIKENQRKLIKIRTKYVIHQALKGWWALVKPNAITKNFYSCVWKVVFFIYIRVNLSHMIAITNQFQKNNLDTCNSPNSSSIIGITNLSLVMSLLRGQWSMYICHDPSFFLDKNHLERERTMACCIILELGISFVLCSMTFMWSWVPLSGNTFGSLNASLNFQRLVSQ